MNRMISPQPRDPVASTAALVLCALFAVSAAHSQQRVTLPGTKAGELLGQLLKHCDAPRLPAINRWLTANSPHDVLASGNLGFIAHDVFDECVFDGGLRPERTLESEPGTIAVLASGRKDNIWYRLMLTADTDGKITDIETMPTAPPEASLPKDLSDSAIRNDLRHFVKRLAAAGRFSGIVVVARGQKAIVTVSAGYAVRSRHSPITGRTQFTLGSMGKMFTATGMVEHRATRFRTVSGGGWHFG